MTTTTQIRSDREPPELDGNVERATRYVPEVVPCGVI